MSREEILTTPDQWVGLHGDHLYSYALMRLRDPAAAQDAVQETLLAALKAKDGFSGQSSERTWLIGILKHKIVDHFRNVAREAPAGDMEDQVEEFDDRFDRSGHWNPAPSKWKFDPGNDLENKELREAIASCLQGLKPNIASAFALREMEGVAAEEICKILGVTPTNLYVMLYRARMGMRECLDEKWFGKGGPK